jgi:sulfite reductase alpha subunit-like flavoprotein
MIRRRKVIFICGTASEDKFPANAQRFMKTLKESPDRLSDVQYAILGLGKQDSKVFRVAGRSLEVLMSETGDTDCSEDLFGPEC